MDLGLAGKRAIVTGGTRGIGRSIVETLIAEGSAVAFCARDRKEVDGAVAAITAGGGKAMGKVLDVADHGALTAWVGEVAAAWGGLDIAVANASALVDGPSIAAFRRAFEVDLLHTVTLADAARPHLTSSGHGAFVAISSISGSEDYGYDGVAYGTMKAALFYYVKCLANDFAKSGARANVVSPGTTYFEGGFWHVVEQQKPEAFAEALAGNPMGRMVRPEDIARAAVFLASPMSASTTGTNLVVDGGFTKRVQT